MARIAKINPPVPSHLVPPNRDDLLAATHPSEHNAVFAFHRKYFSEESQKSRREKFAKRQAANAKLAKAGRIDKRDIERSHGHDPAFLTPVPLHLYNPASVGCAAATWNVVNSESSLGGIGGCASVSH
jgi:hypothetical protein